MKTEITHVKLQIIDMTVQSARSTLYTTSAPITGKVQQPTEMTESEHHSSKFSNAT